MAFSHFYSVSVLLCEFLQKETLPSSVISDTMKKEKLSLLGVILNGVETMMKEIEAELR